MCLESWVDISAFGCGNSDDDVLKRFGTNGAMSAQGMKFPVGQIQVESPSSTLTAQPRAPFATKKVGRQDGVKTNIVKKMVVCKVAVGRSFMCDEANAPKETLPAGYDSFHLRHSATGSSAHRHEYYIKDATQVLPLYLVTFEFDPVKEKQSREVCP